MVFSDKLKQLRLAAGFSQAELAKQSGISQAAISHWELGNRKGGPNVAQLFALCDALEVDCSEFRDVRVGSEGEVSIPDRPAGKRK